MAGVMLSQITDSVMPEPAKLPEVERHGKVLIGTVEGDIHDIVKDIVVFILDVNGFDVLDLGVEVSPREFVEAIRDFWPQVVGPGGFPTLAFDWMKDSVDTVKTAALQDKVRIMIGGGQIDDKIREYAGADANRDDAMEAVNLARKWVAG
ncbi:MAG: cobalamin-dependent protein [Anaerolineae bacterium]